VYILDTNVTSELIKVQRNEKVINWLLANQENCWLTAITVKEMYFGALRLDRGKRRENLLNAIAAFEHMYVDKTLAFDSSCCKICAELHLQTIEAGHNVSAEDMMIAAICKRHGGVLVTRNIKDFQYSGIKLFNPFELA
jgi:predicted nucleic acid-binding protein